jgi:hypothetical protein
MPEPLSSRKLRLYLILAYWALDFSLPVGSLLCSTDVHLKTGLALANLFQRGEPSGPPRTTYILESLVELARP